MTKHYPLNPEIFSESASILIILIALNSSKESCARLNNYGVVSSDYNNRN